MCDFLNCISFVQETANIQVFIVCIVYLAHFLSLNMYLLICIIIAFVPFFPILFVVVYLPRALDVKKVFLNIYQPL